MRNKIIGFVVFLFWQMGASAQDTLKNTSILLVPFPPEYYLSDAERDIMAQTKRSPEEFRNYFRKTLDLKIQGDILIIEFGGSEDWSKRWVIPKSEFEDGLVDLETM